MIPSGIEKGLKSKEVRVVGNGGCSKMFGGDVGSCSEGCGDWSGLINYKGRKSLVAFIRWLIEFTMYKVKCLF